MLLSDVPLANRHIYVFLISIIELGGGGKTHYEMDIANSSSDSEKKTHQGRKNHQSTELKRKKPVGTFIRVPPIRLS